MVRYKSRYLLFQILDPESPPLSKPPSSSSSSSSNNNKNSLTSTHLDFCLPSDPSITPQYLASLIRDIINTNFGDWGSGVTGSLSIKYFSPVTSTGIIRCSRDHYRLVWAALTFISSVVGSGGGGSGGGSGGGGSRPCVVRVVRVSGTIKKAEMECIRKGKEEIIRLRGNGNGNEGVVVEEEEGKDEEMLESG